MHRLSEYLKAKDIKHATFEKELSLGNGYVRKQLAGKGSIGSEVLGKIIPKFLDISLIWLLTGKGEMFADSSEILEKEKQSKIIEHFKKSKELSDSSQVLIKIVSDYLQRIERLEIQIKELGAIPVD